MKSSGFTHDNVNNKTIDWYTPKWIFEELGLTFDLDPCAPEGGVAWIPAKKHYSLRDDGLCQPWGGLVWLNPPYGKYTALWLNKMNKHRNGIALVFSRTDTKWFTDYVTKADGILFMRGRIKFVDALGTTSGNGAGAGSMMVAWGSESVNALKAFQTNNGGLFVPLKG